MRSHLKLAIQMLLSIKTKTLSCHLSYSDIFKMQFF